MASRGTMATLALAFTFTAISVEVASAATACPDSIPPSASPLSAGCGPNGQHVLTWTAPSDETRILDPEDNCVTTLVPASSYDIRWSTSPIVTLADFNGATPIGGAPTPSAPGSAETVSIFVAEQSIYIALRSVDAYANASPFTSVYGECACPDTTAPTATSLSASCASGHVLHWTAPGDPTSARDASGKCVDGVGPATSYDIRWSAAPIVTLSEFEAAAQIPGPTPSAPGMEEAWPVPVQSDDIYLALRSVDQHSNASPITSVRSVCAFVGVENGNGLTFGIEGVRPNPSSSGRVMVSFVLPVASPATLQLMDAKGRLVAIHDVGKLGPGRHMLDLAAGRHLRSGVYLARLTQGNLHSTWRVVLLGP